MTCPPRDNPRIGKKGGEFLRYGISSYLLQRIRGLLRCGAREMKTLDIL
jgi:hypothetical protein